MADICILKRVLKIQVFILSIHKGRASSMAPDHVYLGGMWLKTTRPLSAARVVAHW